MDSVALPIAPPYLFPFAPDLGPRRRAVAIEETIGLSPRVARALSQAGIGTFEQLAELSVAELLEIPDLGFAALSEIHDTLHKLGLTGQQTEQRPQPLRTSLEEELWRLTAPAGAAVERGIAMVYFGWDGRLAMEEIRDRYRVRRDLLRRIFLAVETQPPPDRSQVRSIRLAARFVAAHSPLWLEDAETLLHTAGLVQQQLTLQGLQQACRIAGIPSGLSLVRTPRLLVVHQSRLEECRIVVRTLQHLAALRGTTTIDEVKSCSEKMLDRELDRKFVRRSMALISTLRWLDPRLGIATLAS